MLNFLKNLFGVKSVHFPTLVRDGAQIVDVRTPSEYAHGHLKNSVNIPLQNLASEINKLKPGAPVITCCASGMRSASAKALLKNKGFEVYNGGGWQSLQNKLEK